jgi:tetratricopeptide (TPR) repeat protein
LGAVEFAEDQYAAARGAFRSALRFNASDEATQRELALCERILELDPAVRGLGPAERYRRSAALLEAALGRAEQCLPKVSQAADAQPLRTWADTARQSPARQPARWASDGAAESHRKPNSRRISRCELIFLERTSSCARAIAAESASVTGSSSVGADNAAR